MRVVRWVEGGRGDLFSRGAKMRNLLWEDGGTEREAKRAAGS